MAQRTDIPIQLNGFDCGPFLLAFARNAVVKDLNNFSEENMSVIRKNICLELYDGKLRKRD